ncbi:preprotein translocase subunit SecY [Ruminococcaceae bacterium OttesenSCG-928-D13]|nr:preprotein translocase subunit SecY [Ruminococcaceae bacterium OttesenSCG-928-D13]
MFTTFRNAWKIAELRKKILFTVLILVIFRAGIALPVPFVNVSLIGSMITENSGDVLGFMDFMSGGALSSASVFALTVQPYINASIIMQLLGVAFPALDRMRKEGPEGQKKFNKITRMVGAALAAVLGVGYYFLMRNTWNNDFTMNGVMYGPGSDLFSQIFSAVVIVSCFVAGAVLLMWLGEQIDTKGIGNGISMLIFAGIISRSADLITTVKGSMERAAAGEPQIYIYLPIIAILALAAIVMVIVLNNAERRIPIQYAKKVVGRKMYGGQSSFFPIKVNMSGVMPIIFASAITTIPATIIRLFNPAADSFWGKTLHAMSIQGVGYAIIYGLLIVAFNYFYVAITYNPIEIANNLKKNNGAIPGIRPGKPTSDFISKTISRVTLIGAIFLVVVAIGPILLGNLTGVGIQLGGTSLLIVVGVALDTSRSLESFMLMRHHKGFLE